MSLQKREDEKRKLRERMCKLRQKRKLEAKKLKIVIASPAFSSKSSESRATKRAIINLPRSPRKAKKVVENLADVYGIKQSPLNATARERIPESTINDVLNFYEREDVSSWSPGRKDFITVKDSTMNKTQVQKRYLICSLRETYSLFKKDHPDTILSFTKFCELRPQHIQTFGKCPLDTCCCLHHKNFEALCNGLASVIPNMQKYSHDWVRMHVLCDLPNEACKNSQCEECSRGENLLRKIGSTECINGSIKYACWVSDENGHTQRVHVEQSVSEAFEHFKEKLPLFITHQLTREHQAKCFKEVKDNLDSQTILFHFDFAQNYTCSYQDAAQSAYWCQKQVTIFTVSIYKKDTKKMAAIVSDNLNHSKESICVYLETLFKKYTVSGMNIVLWSDGPSSQFKNRFMLQYLQILKQSFQAKSIAWNFFAASHGKGSVDGIGAVLKRFVWLRVKARQNEVRNAIEFFEVAKETKVECILVSEASIEERYSELKSQIEAAPIAKGIKLDHYWSVVDVAAVRKSLSPVVQILEQKPSVLKYGVGKCEFNICIIQTIVLYT